MTPHRKQKTLKKKKKKKRWETTNILRVEKLWETRRKKLRERMRHQHKKNRVAASPKGGVFVTKGWWGQYVNRSGRLTGKDRLQYHGGVHENKDEGNSGGSTSIWRSKLKGSGSWELGVLEGGHLKRSRAKMEGLPTRKRLKRPP